MEAEASSFETSEMLAAFLASTQLLHQSWRLCNIANTTAPPGGFVVDQIEGISYLAFSGIQTVCGPDDYPSHGNLVPLDAGGCNGIWNSLQLGNNEGEEEETVMVHAGLLQLFLNIYNSPDFQNQMLAILTNSKSVIITGHSIGGAAASLTTLWVLCYLQTIISSSPISIFCINFGSPLLGNESLSKVILREKWNGNFVHVVSKHDLMPRLLLLSPPPPPPPLPPTTFSPPSPLSPQLRYILLQFWHFSMAAASSSSNHIIEMPDEEKARMFYYVLSHLPEGSKTSPFRPFGNYVFCCEEGAICMDNSDAIVNMMHVMLMDGSPNSCIEDHLKYGDYIGKVSLQFLKKRNFMEGDQELLLPQSSYEAGLALALQSSGIATRQELVARPAKDCLEMARRMGRTPNLKSANLAILLSKITPYRAEIEWYKASCDASDDKMGYYDSFKRRVASKRNSKVNMNRHKLGIFWNKVIDMLDNNELPHDFHKRAKWVMASLFYKLLVEPLDIAEYYRTGKHRIKGHYRKHGRERRYEIFDRWLREQKVSEEENSTYQKRSKFAGLTQDSCFWARVEEARELLENARSETDMVKLSKLWQDIDKFEMYSRELVESKEVSCDVVAKNSSYSLWVEDWRELKSTRMMHFPLQYPSFMDGEVVP